MGALHAGHLSLVDRSNRENEVTVCSIFINPSQFNNKEDFRLYPVTIEKDIEMLIHAGADILFLPSEAEIYPPGYRAPIYEIGRLESLLEGSYRPGHFQGVCQVVDRLLDLVAPDQLYLGQKDYQQCMVIEKLTALRKQASPRIVISPTVRESDGLAMSSRNTRLTGEQREKALQIFRSLSSIKLDYQRGDFGALKDKAIRDLEKAGFQVDYVEIADAGTLEPAHSPSQKLVALIAATMGDVRLIDNMLLN